MSRIREVRLEDLNAIMEIYNHYVVNTTVSFDEVAWTIEDAIHKYEILNEGGYPFFCCEVEGEIVGYCYLSNWNSRSAYKTTAEVTIYLKPDMKRRGYGRAMLKALVDVAKEGRYHSLIAAITIPNEASVALHEEFGFVKVSFFPAVGYKLGGWCDVGHWQWLASESK
ncbi:MAG: N-acetyltransferase family protein [Rikenellaceae bacterium]